MDKKYNIIDTTLREGEQTPGVLFSLEEKKYILNELVGIGVNEVELGLSSRYDASARLLIDYCRLRYPELKLSLWCRCKKEDIGHALTLRPDILSLSIPVSDIHLKHKLRKDRQWVMQEMLSSISFAGRGGLSVSIGFEDATRCDADFLHKMASAAEQQGAERLRIADTVGVFSPHQYAQLVSSLLSALKTCRLAVHTHNDFGMATANAIAALEAGASFVDVTVLGLGERAGCARLEEVVGYLSLAKGVHGLQPKLLKRLANYVADIAGRNIDRSRPVIGDEIFTCETGLHVQGLQNSAQTYEPFDPEKVLATRKLLFGAKSGRRAIVQRMSQLNPNFSDDLSETAIRAVREAARSLRRPLSDSELIQVITSL